MTTAPYILHLFTLLIGAAIGIAATIFTLKHANQKSLTKTPEDEFYPMPVSKTFNLLFEGEHCILPIYYRGEGYKFTFSPDAKCKSINMFRDDQKNEMNKMLSGIEYTCICTLIRLKDRWDPADFPVISVGNYYIVLIFENLGSTTVQLNVIK